MKIVNIIIFLIVTTLCVAAGGAKIMKIPKEAAFFETLGIDLIYMMILGAVQIAAAIFLIFYKTRNLGAILAAAAFLVSAGMILKTGQMSFGLFSLLPVLLSLYIIKVSKSVPGMGADMGRA